MINQIEKGIFVIFIEKLFISSYTTITARVSECDAENVILFQIEDFGRNVKDTPFARYFIKVAAHPSFKWLIRIKWRNRIHKISRFSCISYLALDFLLFLVTQRFTLNLVDKLLKDFLFVWDIFSIVRYNRRQRLRIFYIFI